MNILDIINIETLETSPSNTLLKKLESVKKNVFEPNDRIVFSCYGEVNVQTLYYIEWCCYFVDIPFFFVVCNSNQQQVVDFFIALDPQITITDRQELHVQHKDNNVKPLFYNANLCTHPWAGLHVWPDGSTSICCEYNGKIGDYNVKKDSIEDIFYSDEMEDIRQQFREGKTPSQCSNCLLKESQGIQSKRNIASTKHKNILSNIEFESQGKLLFMGGHLGNLCNAKCRICSSFFSSSIAAEDIKHGNQKQIKHARFNLKENIWDKNFDFWNRLKKYDSLCNFEFLGGETFLQKHNIQYMEWLVETGKSKDCMFEIVTNGSVLPEVITKLSKEFYNFSITVSIDNLFDKFELERKGVFWDDLEQNLDTLCNLPNVNVGVNVTVSMLNVLYLPEIYNWLQTKPVSYYHFSILRYPTHLSINQVTNDYKHAIIDKLTNSNIAELNYIVDVVNKSKPGDANKFINYMKHKDKIRNEDFSVTHPEVARFYY